MAKSRLDKRIEAEIDGLKLISINRVLPIIFILDEASLDKEETVNTGELKERLVIGRIFPNSEIFKEGAFQIEIKLPLGYPLDPPKVRFVTPIYHPNVTEQGEFRHELLMKTARWNNNTSLIDIVKVIVDNIDEPNTDYPINHEVGKEYNENRDQFNRKASEFVKKYALPRN